MKRLEVRQATLGVDGVTLADARHLRAVVRARTKTQRVDVHSAGVHVRAFDDQSTPASNAFVHVFIVGEERIRVLLGFITGGSFIRENRNRPRETPYERLLRVGPRPCSGCSAARHARPCRPDRGPSTCDSEESEQDPHPPPR